MFPHLKGIEFDWFAIDGESNSANFATAEEGFLPSAVAENHEDHRLISDSLGSPRLETPEVSKDHADIGFYVFDWALPGGPYEKRESANGPLNTKLKAKVMAMAKLPKFTGSFVNFETVAR